MIEAARELEGDMGLVEPRDRHLFDPGNLPGEDDPVQKIEDWVEAVRRSKTRMERREERGRRTIDAFLEGQAGDTTGNWMSPGGRGNEERQRGRRDEQRRKWYLEQTWIRKILRSEERYRTCGGYGDK